MGVPEQRAKAVFEMILEGARSFELVNLSKTSSMFLWKELALQKMGPTILKSRLKS